MDAYTQEKYNLILKYLNDKYPDRYNHMTIELLRTEPYYKQLWTWWTARAYYGDHTFFGRLEDTPEGLESIWIIDSKMKRNYVWKKGKYEYLQQLSKESCKEIYGDKTPGTY